MEPLLKIGLVSSFGEERVCRLQCGLALDDCVGAISSMLEAKSYCVDKLFGKQLGHTIPSCRSNAILANVGTGVELGGEVRIHYGGRSEIRECSLSRWFSNAKNETQ